MKQLRFAILICLTIAHASANTPSIEHNVKSLITKSLWSLDSVDFAVVQNKSASLCFALGAVAFSIKQLSDKTIRGKFTKRDHITDQLLINSIRSLPYLPSVCIDDRKLNKSDYRDIQTFKTELRTKLKEILLYLK